MNPIALLFLVLAAVLHTGWNLILKRVEPRFAFTWWALIAGGLAFLPALVLSGPVPRTVWPLALASATVEVAYFATLSWAYRRADFSLVYPMARGAAPILLALWALLFLGERIAPGGVAGLAVLVAGLLVVGGSGLWVRLVRSTSAGPGPAPAAGPGVLAALGVAACISTYSVIDAAAVQTMAPAAYNELVLGMSAVLAAPLMFRRFGRRVLLTTLAEHRGRIVAVGLLMFLAYTLVLQAYALAPVTYAAAIREVSIVFAAVAGWRWLKEGFGPLRTVGAALILGGIILIAWKG